MKLYLDAPVGKNSLSNCTSTAIDISPGMRGEYLESENDHHAGLLSTTFILSVVVFYELKFIAVSLIILGIDIKNHVI